MIIIISKHPFKCCSRNIACIYKASKEDNTCNLFTINNAYLFYSSFKCCSRNIALASTSTPDSRCKGSETFEVMSVEFLPVGIAALHWENVTSAV